jgi:hypothetical protein
VWEFPLTYVACGIPCVAGVWEFPLTYVACAVEGTLRGWCVGIPADLRRARGRPCVAGVWEFPLTYVARGGHCVAGVVPADLRSARGCPGKCSST